jgi:hypothetical protein
MTPGKAMMASNTDARALTALLYGSNHRAVRGSTNGQRVSITSSDIAKATSPQMAANAQSDLAVFAQQTGDRDSFASDQRRVRVIQQGGEQAEETTTSVRNPANVHNPPLSESGGHSGRAALD